MTNVANYDGTPKVLCQDLHPHLLYKAATNPDILYIDQALNSSHHKEFMRQWLRKSEITKPRSLEVHSSVQSITCQLIILTMTYPELVCVLPDICYAL